MSKFEVRDTIVVDVVVLLRSGFNGARSFSLVLH